MHILLQTALINTLSYDVNYTLCNNTIIHLFHYNFLSVISIKTAFLIHTPYPPPKKKKKIEKSLAPNKSLIPLLTFPKTPRKNLNPNNTLATTVKRILTPRTRGRVSGAARLIGRVIASSPGDASSAAPLAVKILAALRRVSVRHQRVRVCACRILLALTAQFHTRAALTLSQTPVYLHLALSRTWLRGSRSYGRLYRGLFAPG